jgi:hypothetical protein
LLLARVTAAVDFLEEAFQVAGGPLLPSFRGTARVGPLRSIRTLLLLDAAAQQAAKDPHRHRDQRHQQDFPLRHD